MANHECEETSKIPIHELHNFGNDLMNVCEWDINTLKLRLFWWILPVKRISSGWSESKIEISSFHWKYVKIFMRFVCAMQMAKPLASEMNENRRQLSTDWVRILNFIRLVQRVCELAKFTHDIFYFVSGFLGRSDCRMEGREEGTIQNAKFHCAYALCALSPVVSVTCYLRFEFDSILVFYLSVI